MFAVIPGALQARPGIQSHMSSLLPLDSRSLALLALRNDRARQTSSDSVIRLMAASIGERAAVSMIALRPPSAATPRAVVDACGPASPNTLAMRRMRNRAPAQGGAVLTSAGWIVWAIVIHVLAGTSPAMTREG
jgi:hypothetical protein